MKNYIILVFLVSCYGISVAQERYPEKEVTLEHDTMCLKKTMHKISGIVYNEHGEVGEFKEGLQEGLHKEWYRSGNLKDEINYNSGQKNGEYRYWSDQSQLIEEGHYVKGELDGLIKEWYKNGNIKLEVNYKAGEMHGLRTEWYKSGHKWSEQVMKDGYVESGKHFYNDGTEMTHGTLIKHK
jgi:antitoxin component YwqK of YwqJK toxin-antitoxin module